MSAARTDNAARDLLARLTDEAELESVPLDEVRADLTRLGIDPARSIRFGRQLVAQAASPAAGLLSKSLAGEVQDREQAELEHADIDIVRAELSAASPLAPAQAQRLAEKIVPSATQRRRSRRLWYGVSGAIMAAAASVLVIVNVSSPDLLPRQKALAPDIAPATQSMAEQESAAPASTLPVTTARGSPAESAPVSKTESATSASGSESRTEVGALAADEDGAAMRLRNGGPGEALSIAGATQAESPAGQPMASGADAIPASKIEIAGLTVIAALILQPELAPEPLRRANLGEGDLASRLTEAANPQPGGTLVALVTLLRTDGTSFDARLLWEESPFSQFSNSSGGATDSIGDASEMNNPALAKPTLRDLLGSDAEAFRLIEMKSPAAAGQE